MKRALAGFLGGLFLLGLVAAFSGAAEVDEAVGAVKEEWVVVQSLPPGPQKVLEMQQLQNRAHDLASRYPNNDKVREWRDVIDSSYHHIVRRELMPG